MTAEVPAFRRNTMVLRLSRNHSGEGSRGSLFENRKKRLALADTNARTSFPPMRTTTLSGLEAYYNGKPSQRVIGKIPSSPEITQLEAF
jgi:hypothetical protein